MRKSRPPGERAAAPIGPGRLGELALAYVARFATTRAKLGRYLARKIRERGWDGDGEASAAVDQIVERMTALGFVDDRHFATMRSGAMVRRGLGARRVRSQLWVDGIASGDAAVAIAEAEGHAFAAIVAFARRKRWGPFAHEHCADPKLRERQVAAFARAGHASALARRIIDLAPGDEAGLAALDESGDGG